MGHSSLARNREREIQITVATRPADSHESRMTWLVSLAFWIFLLCAACCYSAVALAPRFLTYLNLKSEQYANQVRLVRLEQQVEYLKRVADALEHEPEFAAEMARIDFDATRPGDERIAVKADLTLDARVADSTTSLPIARMPWYGPMVYALAKDERTRQLLLTVSIILVIVAFTFLQESSAPAPAVHSHRDAKPDHSVFQWLIDRYRQPDADVESEERASVGR